MNPADGKIFPVKMKIKWSEYSGVNSVKGDRMILFFNFFDFLSFSNFSFFPDFFFFP